MDVLDAIATILHAFRSADLNPPTAILFGSHKEGMRFLSALRQTSEWVAIVGGPDLGHPVEMADGSVWMGIKIMGTAIRWPANRIAMPDGTWGHT